MQVTLPREKLTITAISGLESEAAHLELDLTGNHPATVDIHLPRFVDLKSQSWHSANTHLHLMKLTREDADRYLAEIPRADRLDMLFVSYLERAGADHEYITNRLTSNDLSDLAARSGVIFGNGEEHRHNLAGYGEGYGHVMFLNIAKLIQPVSIGPGIMKTGTDGLPLQRGVDTARRDAATVVWCHNGMGLETLANIATGRVDAQNIFDGGNRGSYADSFYQYWNAGFPVPISTGTDWFIYDLSRVYTRTTTPNSQPAPLSLPTWLASLKRGNSFITNGPILDFKIHPASNDPAIPPTDIGETLDLPHPTRLTCIGTARSRSDFHQLELVRNGEIIATSPSHPVDNHFESTIRFEFQSTEPAWLALRTPPPLEKKTDTAKPDPQSAPTRPHPTNEFGREIFAHTSPIHIHHSGKPYFHPPTADKLLQRMQSNRDHIATYANFADPQQRAAVLDIHHDAIETMTEHLNRNR
ncbi:MAG: CehA/McbA family metallohydrolase [Planctomycetaceae bacterium]|nr:CehA/McbA family metallohydrolase [Planctomycetaceae bacterium]